MTWRIVEAICEAGLAVNEDAAGIAGSLAWIADGASGLPMKRAVSEGSDAAWLVARLDESLRRIGSEEPSPDLAALPARTEAEIREAFAALDGEELPHSYHGPSACLAVASVAPGDEPALTGFVIGDVAALVPTADGVRRFTDERVKPFEALTLATLVDRADAAVPARTFEQIWENRRSLNERDGYFVVHPLRAWAPHVRRFTVKPAAGQPVVLASDGFLRLVDLFSAYDDAGLYAALAEGHANELVDELRRRERDDPLGQRYLRVKPHDDATVLVVTAAEP